jgi:hypothetical protein
MEYGVRVLIFILYYRNIEYLVPVLFSNIYSVSSSYHSPDSQWIQITTILSRPTVEPIGWVQVFSENNTGTEYVCAPWHAMPLHCYRHVPWEPRLQ